MTTLCAQTNVLGTVLLIATLLSHVSKRVAFAVLIIGNYNYREHYREHVHLFFLIPAFSLFYIRISQNL